MSTIIGVSVTRRARTANWQPVPPPGVPPAKPDAGAGSTLTTRPLRSKSGFPVSCDKTRTMAIFICSLEKLANQDSACATSSPRAGFSFAFGGALRAMTHSLTVAALPEVPLRKDSADWPASPNNCHFYVAPLPGVGRPRNDSGAQIL